MTWLAESWTNIGIAALKCVAILILLNMIIRFYGLRSFAKMSATDTAVTIAMGAVLSAHIMTTDNSIVKTAVVIFVLIGFQYLYSYFNKHNDSFTQVVKNQPILLMKNGKILEDNLAQTEVSIEDIRAKLREANVIKLSQVLAVVLETTGDVSVLHSEKDSLDDFLLEGISA